MHCCYHPCSTNPVQQAGALDGNLILKYFSSGNMIPSKKSHQKLQNTLDLETDLENLRTEKRPNLYLYMMLTDPMLSILCRLLFKNIFLKKSTPKGVFKDLPLSPVFWYSKLTFADSNSSMFTPLY